ncbi:MAG: ABC transporter ATP-binding protein [Spirochaetota bacterium]
MSILNIENLSLSLGEKPILNNLNIDFWKGHIHAIIGPNGAGKSTLAFTIMGLIGYRDFNGDIRMDGKSIRDMSVDERARMGISLGWQEPARFEGLTVRNYLKASTRQNQNDNLEEALNMVGLDPDSYLSRSVDKTLSGGERKRIELASLIVMQPRLVLLDEPDSGIDVEALERIFDAIKILKDKGSTIILITHSLAVLNQAEHAFLMCCGELVDKGSIDKVKVYFENKCIPCNHKNVPDAEEVIQ